MFRGSTSTASFHLLCSGLLLALPVTALISLCLFALATPVRGQDPAGFPGSLAVERAMAMNDRIRDQYLYQQPDSAILLARELLSFAKEHQLREMQAKAYNLMGVALYQQGLFAEALGNHEEALTISRSSGLLLQEATALNNMGSIFQDQDDPVRALDCFSSSAALLEKSEDKRIYPAVLANIGIIYSGTRDYLRAIEYFTRSLEADRAEGNDIGVASSLNDLGLIWLELGDAQKALSMFEEARKIHDRNKSDKGTAHSINNAGLVFLKQGDYARALSHFRNALSLRQKIDYRQGVANTLADIGKTFRSMEQTDSAMHYLHAAHDLALRTGLISLAGETSQALYMFYKNLGKPGKALEMLEIHRQMQDSLSQQKIEEKLAQQKFQAEYDRREALFEAEVARQKLESDLSASKRSQQLKLSLAILTGLLLVTGILIVQRNRIAKEKKKSDELLCNILPEQTAAELKAAGTAETKSYASATVLFADFKDFTTHTPKFTPNALVARLNDYFSAFDEIVGRHGVEKIKTIGDAYMAAGGLPQERPGHACDVVAAACEMLNCVQKKKQELEARGEIAFELRIGIHTGPLIAGIVGTRKFQYDIWGETVNIASRMQSHGTPGKINLSDTTYVLVKNAFSCSYAGEIEAKGLGRMRLYHVGKEGKT